MFYAIIKQTSTSAEAEYTGVVYDYMNDSIIDPHKEQGFFIEELETALTPINQQEILQYEINNRMSPSGSPEMPPMPIYRSVTKSDAMKAMDFYITDMKNTKNAENFTYNGHEYYADVESIQATQNQCLTMNDNDDIPVQNGAWKTAEVDGSNNPVFQTFTVSEFKAFAKTLFDRGASNFSVKESHISALRTMVNDDTKTITDIFNYDYSTGWNA